MFTRLSRNSRFFNKYAKTILYPQRRTFRRITPPKLKSLSIGAAIAATFALYTLSKESIIYFAEEKEREQDESKFEPKDEDKYEPKDEYKFPTHLLKVPKSGRGIVLVECGSFNPPTILHLRLFESARDALQKEEGIEVVGAYLSPVHESYGKSGLLPNKHRLEMAKLATQTSNWIAVDDWECRQPTYSYTRNVLEHFDQELKKYYSQFGRYYDIRAVLLCGADLLQSFTSPGVWAQDDVEYILSKHGVVCFEREGVDVSDIIFESDLLQKYSHNIFVVKSRIKNDVSSTRVRRLLKRGYSVKYYVPDPVIEYIEKHNLYKSDYFN